MRRSHEHDGTNSLDDFLIFRVALTLEISLDDGDLVSDARVNCIVRNVDMKVCGLPPLLQDHPSSVPQTPEEP